jgi:hypothetical protein
MADATGAPVENLQEMMANMAWHSVRGLNERIWYIDQYNFNIWTLKIVAISEKQ